MSCDKTDLTQTGVSSHSNISFLCHLDAFMPLFFQSFHYISLYISAFLTNPSFHSHRFSLLSSPTLRIIPTLFTPISYSLHLPLTQSPLRSESLHHLNLLFVHSHTFVLSFLPLHLTRILVNSLSLFLLRLLPTCLPIPENKLKALA